MKYVSKCTANGQNMFKPIFVGLVGLQLHSKIICFNFYEIIGVCFTKKKKKSFSYIYV